MNSKTYKNLYYPIFFNQLNSRDNEKDDDDCSDGSSVIQFTIGYKFAL